MKKSFITVTIIVLMLFLLDGCSDKNQKDSDIFYGETDKWIVIGTIENTFKFCYKGDTDDLIKDNPERKISFSYGTLQGCTVMTEELNLNSFYEVVYSDNYIDDLEVNSKSENNENKQINVQISYGKLTDNIDLDGYFSYEDR